MKLPGMLWGARRAVSQGPMYHIRSAPARCRATSWDTFKLADVFAAEVDEASEIGEEAAEAASLFGLATTIRKSWAPNRRF